MKKFKLKASVYFHNEVLPSGKTYGVFNHVPVVVKDKEDIKHFENSTLFEEVEKPAKKKTSKKSKAKSE